MAYDQSLFTPFNVGNNGLQPVKQRGAAGNFFLGKKEQFQRIPTQTPQGMEALQMLLSGGMQGIQNPMAGFEPIAQQAQKQFSTQTVPGLAERFTAMGGGQNSSAFQGALGSAGADLQSQLASMASQYGLQNRQGLLQQLQLGLTPQFETQHRPREAGFLENLMGMLAPGLSSASQQYGKQLGQYAGQQSFGNMGQQSLNGQDVIGLIKKLAMMGV